jgi:hypothetical protein
MERRSSMYSIWEAETSGIVDNIFSLFSDIGLYGNGSGKESLVDYGKRSVI